MPNFLGHPDNYIEANPLKTPAHIVPEWYFLPFYAMLRAITFDILWINSKLAGVLAMFGSIAVMLLLPWLDTSRVRSGRYRPMFKVWFWLLVVDFVRADVVRLAAAGAAVRHHQPARARSTGSSSSSSSCRSSAWSRSRCRSRRRSRPTSARTTAPARRRWSAPRSASRPNERGREHVHAEDHHPRRPRGARPRRRRRALAQEHEAAPVTDFRFSFEGPFGRFDQSQLQRGLQVYTEVCAACHGLKFVPFRELAEHGGPAMTEEQMRAFAAMHEVDRRRHRRDPPGDAVGPLPALGARERARPQPDGQGAGRLPRAARPAASTSSCAASAGRSTSPRSCTATPARSSEEAGVGALREPRLPRRLDRDAAAAQRRPGDLRRRHRGDASSRCRRTWPPS